MLYCDCPVCHSDQAIELDVTGGWDINFSTRNSKLSIGRIFPKVCLDCGLVYLDSFDRKALKGLTEELKDEVRRTKL